MSSPLTLGEVSPLGLSKLDLMLSSFLRVFGLSTAARIGNAKGMSMNQESPHIRGRRVSKEATTEGIIIGFQGKSSGKSEGGMRDEG